MQLYINTYGTYVHVKDEMFEIRIKKDKEVEKHHYSAKKVKSIIISLGAALSSDAVKLAITNNIDIEPADKEKVKHDAVEVLKIIDKNFYPKATKYKKRCVTCTYKNICIK